MKNLNQKSLINFLNELDMNDKDEKTSLCMLPISDSKLEKYLAGLNLDLIQSLYVKSSTVYDLI